MSENKNKETDQEFLLRMGRLATAPESGNWGQTREQEADQRRIKSIANHLHDMKCRTEQWSRFNNPNEYPQKYGADHGLRIMLGCMADNMVKAANTLDDKELCLFIDQEFLFGAWRNEMESRDPDMLRNLRGLIINLLRRVSDKRTEPK